MSPDPRLRDAARRVDHVCLRARVDAQLLDAGEDTDEGAHEEGAEYGPRGRAAVVDRARAECERELLVPRVGTDACSRSLKLSLLDAYVTAGWAARAVRKS